MSEPASRAAIPMRRSKSWNTGRSLVLGLALAGLAPVPCSGQNTYPIPLPHDPTHAERARHWCAVHLSRKELAAALSDCDYAIARDPNDSAALSNLGAVWIAANELARALRDFDEAIVLKPRDAGLYFNRGIAHGSVGAHERALADYTDAIAIQPD